MGYAKYVIASLGGQLFGFNSLDVITIEAEGNLMKIDGLPKNFAGLVPLRGQACPVYDLSAKFCVPAANTGCQNVFMQIGKRIIGFKVDSICEIVEIDSDATHTIPQIASSAGTDYVSTIFSVKGNLIPAINKDHLLSPEEIVGLNDALGEYQRQQEERNLLEKARREAEEAARAAKEKAEGSKED